MDWLNSCVLRKMPRLLLLILRNLGRKACLNESFFTSWYYGGSTLNPNWLELRRQEKCSSLAPTSSKFYNTQWAWRGVKLTQLMSIFTSIKVWKYLIKIQLTKSNPKITRGVKVPCLMPIRVKWTRGLVTKRCTESST